MRHRFRLALTIGALACAVGCGSSRDATDQQLTELRRDLAKVRAENAVLGERVDALELERGRMRGQSPTGSEQPTGDRPKLDVVRLEPEPPNPDDPNADTPRPM